MLTPLNPVVNPTDEERHELLQYALENSGRSDDFEYIIKFLSPPPDITDYASPGELKGIKIGIIGGGLAGLTAAFELRKLGAEITIFEASDKRIGGRVYTYDFNTGGRDYGELGAYRIPISHETTWYYINMFGLNMISRTGSDNNFIYVHNTRLRTGDSVERCLYHKYNLTPKEQATSWSILRSYAMNHAYLALPPEIRCELIRILPSYSGEILPLMNSSIRGIFESLGLSQRAVHLLSDLLPVVGSLLHHSYDEIANISYTLDNYMTYTIEGGNSLLPYAFYNSFFSDNPVQYRHISKDLLGHVTVKLGHLVTGIYQSNYRSKIIIKYKNNLDISEGAEVFDYCICAIPFSSLRTVEIKPYFSNIKMQAIRELNYTDAEQTLFYCNRRFWERNAVYGNIYGGISVTDLPIQTIMYPVSGNSWNAPGVLTASYNLGQDATRVGGMPETFRYNLIRRNVEEVHGLPRGFLNSLVEKSYAVHWNTEPFFLGGFSFNMPGQKPLFSYEMQKPEYNNRMFFAGEHISSKHGWMQGALYSGKAAANELASCFKK